MEYRIPKSGEIYRHFKGNLYEVIIIARDSETLEEKVVYKEFEGDAVYVRSLPMFVSLVDKVKYPDVTQEFRFELVKEAISKKVVEYEECNAYDVRVSDNSMIMEFLDLNTVGDKIQYLQSVKEHITEEFIEIVAQSLDFTENDSGLSERYEAILHYLRTVKRYESGRLR